MTAGFTSISPNRLTLLYSCSTASRMIVCKDSFVPLPPHSRLSASEASSKTPSTASEIIFRFLLIWPLPFYQDSIGKNIMPKLTSSSAQQTQTAWISSCAAATLPAAAPSANTAMTPK